MNIVESTKAYESWLGARMPLIPVDLDEKHEKMTEKAFAFLRATFYRWVQLWPQDSGDLATAPEVLGVGDLHIENFGTWRDFEGRLVWGVNDFDEVCRMPYTNDLVRLAVSAELRKNKLPCATKEICASILAGYNEGLQTGGEPFVLSKRHCWLRDLVRTKKLANPVEYWEELERSPNADRTVPKDVKEALSKALPEPRTRFSIVHRQGGLGSLGRRRFTALAESYGASVAREAKELTSSAWGWERTHDRSNEILYAEALSRAVRVADPFLTLHKQWVIRRLAPDCSKVELGDGLAAEEALRLLHAMGIETANIHLAAGAQTRTALIRDLRKRERKWLCQATERMADATRADWKEWKSTWQISFPDLANDRRTT